MAPLTSNRSLSLALFDLQQVLCASAASRAVLQPLPCVHTCVHCSAPLTSLPRRCRPRCAPQMVLALEVWDEDSQNLAVILVDSAVLVLGMVYLWCQLAALRRQQSTSVPVAPCLAPRVSALWPATARGAGGAEREGGGARERERERERERVYEETRWCE